MTRILTLKVAQIERQTPDVLSFELAHPRGLALPAFDAGAHLRVYTPGGFSRAYSLVNPPLQGQAATSYLIGVKLEPAGRGGSRALHERVCAGDLLCVSEPHNTFSLNPTARHHLLLAAGIGLTPLLAMAKSLRARRQPFTLAVFARDLQHVAFPAEVFDPDLKPHLRLHLDQGESDQKIDLHQLLAPAAGTHLYMCGPPGFMTAVRQACQGWDETCIHQEYFSVPDSGGSGKPDFPFRLRLARRQVDVQVAADQTAIQALQDLGVDVPVSCEQGICGTCAVSYVAGEPDHRDYCLSSVERTQKMALCCSRARSETVVLDI